LTAQVVNWLPRTELPLVAPSRPELLEMPEPLVVARFRPLRRVPVEPRSNRPSE
jgi:hypothetical protein